MIMIANENGDWWEWTPEYGDLYVFDTDNVSPEDEVEMALLFDTAEWREELWNNDKLDRSIKKFGTRMKLNL